MLASESDELEELDADTADKDFRQLSICICLLLLLLLQVECPRCRWAVLICSSG